MNEIILLLISIIPHELAHYLGFKICGFNPDIKIRFWGVQIGEKTQLKLTVPQLYWVAVSGPFFGVAFLILFNVSSTIILTHLLMSVLDINLLIQILTLKKKYLKLTIKEINIIQCKNFLKENE